MMTQIQLDKKYNQINFDELSAVALVEFIENTQHISIKEILTETQNLIDEAINLEQSKLSKDLNRLFDKFKEEVDYSIEKDNEEVFPLIKSYGYKKTDELLNYVLLRLEKEQLSNDNIVKLLTRLREITNDYTLPNNADKSFILTYKNLKKIEQKLLHSIDLTKNVLIKQLKLGIYAQPKMA